MGYIDFVSSLHKQTIIKQNVRKLRKSMDMTIGMEIESMDMADINMMDAGNPLQKR